MSGTTFSKRSSPSSRLIELTMAFPWQRLRASSRTGASVESSMSGTFTFRVNTSRKAIMSVSSSRSGLARQTSSTCAPPRTWRRPTSAAWSRSPPPTSSLNLRLPITFVRSPTTTGRRSSSIGRTSIPETMVRRTGAALRGRWRRAHGLERDREHDGNGTPGPGRAFLDAEERGLDVERVLLRLQEEHVGAALEEARRLLGVGGRHLLEGDAARDRDGLRARAHRAGDEARAVGRLAARARLAREPRRRGVDLAHLVLQAVLAEHDARAAEGVGLDDVRSRGEVALVHLADHVGAGEDQVLVAALVLGAAEVPGGEVATL